MLTNFYVRVILYFNCFKKVISSQQQKINKDNAQSL